MKPSEILRKAKAEIERRGFYQGSYFQEGGFAEGPCCVLGACRLADPDYDIMNTGDHGKWRPFLEKAIGARDVVSWNDATGRTVADVHAAFDRAIALAEQEERS